MRSIAVFPHELSPPFFSLSPLFSLWTVCASSVHLPECTGPYILEVNYWIPLPLHSGQFSLLWIVVHWASENVNRSYQPSSNRVESVRCVIPISPLDIKNAPRIQRGNIMLVSWIWLARQNLRRGYTRPWISLLFFFHPRSLCTPSCTPTSHFSLIFVSLCPVSLSSLLPFQTTTAATVSVPAKKEEKKNCLVRVKVSYVCKNNTVAETPGDWQGDWVAAFSL